MKVGQYCTVFAQNGEGVPATPVIGLVVKTGTARQGDTVQPTASLWLFPAGGPGLTYLENVPAYDTEEDARANKAGSWSAYACYGDPNGPAVVDTTAAPESVQETVVAAPAAPPAPVFS